MDAAATPDAAFSLLTDYERVAAVFSNVLRSQTFRCVGAETRLQQVCRAVSTVCVPRNLSTHVLSSI